MMAMLVLVLPPRLCMPHLSCCAPALPCLLPLRPASCRDLWRITTFLRETGFQADVADCRQRVPGLLTFEQFLAATCWGDAARTYEQGIRFDGFGSHLLGRCSTDL
jgi:hypothetical protein